ncbi:MAG TPA: c-type cytochrome [Rhizomicrobium sp.]|nr:c-type cytochrome [Rhizomicrobium sp.]
MEKSSRFLTCTAVACFIIWPVMTRSQAWSATQPEILQSCESCHGKGGDSQTATTPRLNGLQAEYITSRLKKLSDETRTSPHTKVGMFKELSAASDATRSAIAMYFASQRPTDPKPGARAAEGKRIYENGNAAENVIACNQCHGAQGEGHDGAPRIAGQHADYLKAQLQLFNLKFRDHVTMSPNTKTMSKNTMEALASYLAND